MGSQLPMSSLLQFRRCFHIERYNACEILLFFFSFSTQMPEKWVDQSAKVVCVISTTHPSVRFVLPTLWSVSCQFVPFLSFFSHPWIPCTSCVLLTTALVGSYLLVNPCYPYPLLLWFVIYCFQFCAKFKFMFAFDCVLDLWYASVFSFSL